VPPEPLEPSGPASGVGGATSIESPVEKRTMRSEATALPITSLTPPALITISYVVSAANGWSGPNDSVLKEKL
jgi:hypothetical protein